MFSSRSVQQQTADPFARAKPWVVDAQQISDVKKRDAAIATIRAAIVSSDLVEAHAGLIALNQVREVAFDKKGLREIVLPHIAAKSGTMRLAAMYALEVAGREPGDLDRILAAVDGITGPERAQLVHPIAVYSEGNLTGKAGEAVLELITVDNQRDLRQSLAGLWGSKVSPEIEKRLLDLSNGKDQDIAQDAIYFGLSTLKDKSEAVIDRLIAALAEPNSENNGRALWGLGQGVLPASELKVADTMLQLLETRTDSQTRDGALRLLQLYGVERHALALEEMSTRPAVAEKFATKLRVAANQLRKRKPVARK